MMNVVDLLPILCSLVLLLGLLLYLGYPLLTSGRVGAASGPTRQLFERKEQLLGEIVELELDRELGKVSAEDFQRLFAELEAETLAVIDELDRLNGASSYQRERRIEEEVAALRQKTAVPRCRGCGTVRREGDMFCPKCGASLVEPS